VREIDGWRIAEEFVEGALLRRVCVRPRDTLDPVVRGDHVEEAKVAQSWHRQSGEILERGRIVETGAKRFAGFHEEEFRRLDLLALGDILESENSPRDSPVPTNGRAGVAHRKRRCVSTAQPVVIAADGSTSTNHPLQW